MQSKSIKDRADDQGTSRSVRLTAQTMDGSSSTDETQNNPVTNALARLEGVIETKISTLKRDLAIENEENLARMAKRFKPTPKYEFKHDGNRQQHNHQSDVKEALQTAFDALVNSNFDRSKEALEEDSFSSQLWQSIRATQNTRLQRLVTAMPEYLLHAKAHTTVRKYKSE